MRSGGYPHSDRCIRVGWYTLGIVKRVNERKMSFLVNGLAICLIQIVPIIGANCK